MGGGGVKWKEWLHNFWCVLYNEPLTLKKGFCSFALLFNILFPLSSSVGSTEVFICCDCISSPSLRLQFSKETDCLCLRMSVWRDCGKLTEATNTCLPSRAPRNSIREYAKPNFKPTAGELWLRFPTGEHEQRGSTMPVCHTFKDC